MRKRSMFLHKNFQTLAQSFTDLGVTYPFKGFLRKSNPSFFFMMIINPSEHPGIIRYAYDIMHEV